MTIPGAPWPPPEPSTFTSTATSGWFQASDGQWYQSVAPPAEGYWLASDGRWYPPSDLSLPGEPWRASRWGLGDFWWGMLALAVASLGVGVVIAVAIVATDPDQSFDTLELGAYAISMSIVANVIAFAGVPWLATRRKGLRSLAVDFGLRFRSIDVPIGVGVGVAGLVLAAVVGTLIDRALDAPEATSNVPIEDFANAGEFIAFFVAVAIVTPIIEELFYRGLVYRSFLKRGTSVRRSVVLTTLVFVVPHLLAVPEWPGILSLFCSIAVLGAALNMACVWTGNRLSAPIIAHMVVNGTAVVALYVGAI